MKHRITISSLPCSLLAVIVFASLACQQDAAPPALREASRQEKTRGPRNAGNSHAARQAAEALESTGQWVEAATAWQKLSEASTGSDAHDTDRRAIVAWLTADRIDRAEAWARRVLQRRPEESRVLFTLGDAQRVRQHFEEAATTLGEFLEREPEHRLGALLLGHVLTKLGRHEEALPHLERGLVDENSPLPSLWRVQAALDRARALRRLQRRDEAVRALAAILADDPWQHRVLVEAARLYRQTGRRALAETLEARFRELSDRGYLLSDDDPAKVAATRVSDISPAKRALRAIDRREFLETIEMLREALRQDPRDEAAGLILARLLARVRRFADAIDVAESLRAARGQRARELTALRAHCARELADEQAARTAWRDLGEQIDAASSQGGLHSAEPVDKWFARAIDAELTEGVDSAHALRWIERAEHIGLDASSRRLARARLALRNGDTATARALLPLGDEELSTSRRWRLAVATLAGLEGSLQVAARDLMALIGERPRDRLAWAAFTRVFGGRDQTEEVRRALDLRVRLEKRQRQETDRLRAFGARRLEDCGEEYMTHGREAAERGDVESALDSLAMAADLLPASTAALVAIAGLHRSRGRPFLELRALRSVRDRHSTEVAARIAELERQTGLAP